MFNKQKGNVTKAQDVVDGVQRGSENISKCLNMMMSKIPSTKESWAKKRGDLEALILAEGQPTLFGTLSCAEYSWQDTNDILHERNPDFHGNNRLLPGHDCVTTAEQFERRYQAVFKNVILGMSVLF